MGVTQHHDAVSGTSKQHVANDYAKRLYIGQYRIIVCLIYYHFFMICKAVKLVWVRCKLHTVYITQGVINSCVIVILNCQFSFYWGNVAAVKSQPGLDFYVNYLVAIST